MRVIACIAALISFATISVFFDFTDSFGENEFSAWSNEGVVVSVGFDGKSLSCIGYLISTSKVVTARHCLGEYEISKIFFLKNTVNSERKSYDVLIPDLSDKIITSILNAGSHDILVLDLTSNAEYSDIGVAMLDLLPGDSGGRFFYIDYIDGDLGKVYCDLYYDDSKSILLSNTCHPPPGNSGTPIYQIAKSKVVLIGTYHGFLKTKNGSSDGSVGVFSDASHIPWRAK